MTEFIALESLLAGARDTDLPVVLDEQRILARGQWLQRVASWRQLLATRSEVRWGLYHPNAGEFSALIFALWSLGKTACLPPNRQPAVVADLATQVDAFVGDFSGLVTTPRLESDDWQPLTADNQRMLSTLRLDTDAIVLELYTSGSSGQPQAVSKSLRQLSREVFHLHQLWGQSLPQAQVLSTVSHQHIYGLLFRVLWPLAAGWSFSAKHCEYWEQLDASGQGEQPLLLICSPTHLTRMPASVKAQTFKQRLHAVFSSGAPLAREASLAAAELLEIAISEVYGSTETGGVAWRQQTTSKEAHWQPMPSVLLRLDPQSQCLQLCSEHLPLADGWFQTADRASIDNDGRFRLLGRADRIVKVEGKRLSLDDMEARLREHPDVEDARLLVIEGRRVEVAAVVQLSAGAEVLSSSQSKRAQAQIFKNFLLQYFERPLLPRRWRYVSEFAVNTQGKIQRQALLRLFMKTTDSRPQLPDELSRESLDDQGWRLALHIPKDLLFFEGHFDQAAVLPGVVQVHWAQTYGRELFAIAGEFLRMEVVKFQKVIHPGEQVELALQFDTKKNKLHFCFDSKRGRHASGRIVYGA